MNNKPRALGVALLCVLLSGIHAGCSNSSAPAAVEEQWEVAAGPYGGARKSVVVHPQDPAHAITDSVDSSGIGELRDGRWVAVAHAYIVAGVITPALAHLEAACKADRACAQWLFATRSPWWAPVRTNREARSLLGDYGAS